MDLYLTPHLTGFLSGKMGGRRRIDVIASQCHAAGASVIWVHPENDRKTSVDVFRATSQER
jgi:hypothetical protein